MSKPRAERYFPAEAFELRQVAREIKLLGLPSPASRRNVERLRQIADRIDCGDKTADQPRDGEGGQNP